MTTYHSVPIEELSSTLPIERETSIQIMTKRKRKSRSILATLMLTICVITFVLQTELTQYVQKTTSYSKPYFILYISHSCYVFMIPIQFVGEYIQQQWYCSSNEPLSINQRLVKTFENYKLSFQSSLHDLLLYQPETNPSPLFFILKMSLYLSALLTLPSYIWYLSVNLTSMSNLTAIYNTGCFFAYLFSILMLHDRIVPVKVGAVILCLIGVLTMALWSTTDSEEEDRGGSTIRECVGIIVASIGAALYGFYEVFYKKYASPSPSHSTILFANTITGIIGIVTFLFLWLPFPLLHLSGIEEFEWPDRVTMGSILAIASMSVIYNATFMAVIALVNPVFAAVGVMLTIPAVAVTDIFVTGVMVPMSTIIGSLFILLGFIILNKQVAQEEQEKTSSSSIT